MKLISYQPPSVIEMDLDISHHIIKESPGMGQLSKFECMVSGMPHILDYCGTMSLVNMSRVSRLTNHTTVPIIKRKLQRIPINVKINDTEMVGDTSVVYSIHDYKLTAKIKFHTPYEISMDTTFVDNTFFHIYTPFDICGIDTNIRDYIPMNYTNELYAQSAQPIGPDQNIFYHDVRDKNTQLRLIFACEYDLPDIPMYETHPNDITRVYVMGIEFSHERATSVSTTELYLLMLGSLVSGVLCGPILAILFPAFLYKCFTFVNDQFNDMYHEKRLKDW